MKKNIPLILLYSLLLIAIGMNSCNYDQYLPPEEPVVVDTIGFASDILPIFNSKCNTSGCHNTGGIPPDLSPVNAYRALIDGGYIDVAVPDNSELLEWMRGNRKLSMPLSGPVPEDNATVLAWIKQGALNN
jgi:hypothetical protein